MKYGGEDCETLYSYCTPGSGDGCSWKVTPEYKKCFKLRESTWFLTEKGQGAYTCRSQCQRISNQSLRYRCIKKTRKLEKQGRRAC